MEMWGREQEGGVESRVSRGREKLRILNGRRVKSRNIPLLKNLGFGG